MDSYDKDAFKQAYTMTHDFIKEYLTGHDADALDNLREYIEGAIQQYASASDFLADLYRRSDICDDDKWELECHEASIEHIFKIYKICKENRAYKAAEEARYD